ncbi:hypothetical protein [Micromonospora costi]|uniref:Uncharacterized protein n=1 Tax=Micromonospora costi TaxID=1530042 RepID=A0A3B0AA04_9ACTN|nr:hypothetical protein [Micromonospora costi]RKN55996.1 hypothetical protein D7193_15540 [Micromonospora costi]
MRTIDNEFTVYGQGYKLARICKLDSSHTVHVRVKRDLYRQQSHAVAEVLTPSLTWTALLTQDVESWHQSSPYVATNAGQGRARQAEALLNQVAIAPAEPRGRGAGRSMRGPRGPSAWEVGERWGDVAVFTAGGGRPAHWMTGRQHPGRVFIRCLLRYFPGLFVAD